MGKFNEAQIKGATTGTRELPPPPMSPRLFSSNYYEQIICSYRDLLDIYKDLLQRERADRYDKIDLTEPSLKYTNDRNIQLEAENIKLKNENENLKRFISAFNFYNKIVKSDPEFDNVISIVKELIPSAFEKPLF